MWKEIDIKIPIKKFWIVLLGIIAIFTLIGIILSFFTSELSTLPKYKVLENYSLEFRWLFIFMFLIVLFSIMISIFVYHNMKKFYIEYEKSKQLARDNSNRIIKIRKLESSVDELQKYNSVLNLNLDTTYQILKIILKKFEKFNLEDSIEEQIKKNFKQ
jgi:uncharacterized membrane protein